MFTVFTLLGLLISLEVKAQTDDSNPQVICEGLVKPYRVDYLEGGGAGTPGSTYTWTVLTAGFTGNIVTNQGPSGSSNAILIVWGTTPRERMFYKLQRPVLMVAQEHLEH